MRFRRIAAALLALALCFALSGCAEREDLMEVRVAYCAAHPAGMEELAFAVRKVAVTDGERLCNLVLQLAMTSPDEENYVSVFPRRTNVRSVSVENGIITVDYSENYGTLTGMDRTLADACTVETLLALGSVDGTEIRGVRILVEGREGQKTLTAADYVDSGEWLRLQNYDFSVWFPNMALMELEEDHFQITLSDREQPAETVVNLLLAGHRSSGRPAQLVTAGTEFYGLEVRSRVCYLNFSEGFLETEGLYTGNSSLRLAAFVNSLCQFSYIDRVQFLIEGEVVASDLYENFDLPYAPS